MKSSRYAVSRRKACQGCFRAKTKCHRLAEAATSCRRCRNRNMHCSYEEDGHKANAATYACGPMSTDDAVSTDGSGNVRWEETATAQIYSNGASAPTSNSGAANGGQILDFSDLRLICSINADDISNRWLNSYIPAPQQRPKAYPASVTAFIRRILNSYVGTVVRRRAPPFIHQTQLLSSTISEPLATCFGVVRMSAESLPGSEAFSAGVLEQEMAKLYECRGMYDNSTLLAAFQAYLIYSMLLFFRRSHNSSAPLQQAMMSLQELACASARQGLVCPEEQQNTRPRWESWIVAEAKRRTLYTMYLFDSLLLVNDNLPTFLASEVQGLLAPGSKTLWNSQTRSLWEQEYNQQLAAWPQGGLRIEELWPIPADLDATGITYRRSRVDQWLEDVDEYGTMMYAVTGCTHSG